MKLFTPKDTKSREQSQLSVIQEQERCAARAVADKLRINNELSVEHTRLMEERRKELATIEFSIRHATDNVQKDIAALEERRRQALMPITEEHGRLECKKRELEEVRQRIDADNKRAQEQLLGVRGRETELVKNILEFVRTKDEALAFIERENKDARERTDTSNVAVTALVKERELHAQSVKELVAKEENAKRAEMVARAAMTAADNRIEKERKEQERTDEKRRMLALAIKELKQRGLWHKARAITTK